MNNKNKVSEYLALARNFVENKRNYLIPAVVGLIVLIILWYTFTATANEEILELPELKLTDSYFQHSVDTTELLLVHTDKAIIALVGTFVMQCIVELVHTYKNVPEASLISANLITNVVIGWLLNVMWAISMFVVMGAVYVLVFHFVFSSEDRTAFTYYVNVASAISTLLVHTIGWSKVTGIPLTGYQLYNWATTSDKKDEVDQKVSAEGKKDESTEGSMNQSLDDDEKSYFDIDSYRNYTILRILPDSLTDFLDYVNGTHWLVPYFTAIYLAGVHFFLVAGLYMGASYIRKSKRDKPTTRKAFAKSSFIAWLYHKIKDFDRGLKAPVDGAKPNGRLVAPTFDMTNAPKVSLEVQAQGDRDGIPAETSGQDWNELKLLDKITAASTGKKHGGTVNIPLTNGQLTDFKRRAIAADKANEHHFKIIGGGFMNSVLNYAVVTVVRTVIFVLQISGSIILGSPNEAIGGDASMLNLLKFWACIDPKIEAMTPIEQVKFSKLNFGAEKNFPTSTAAAQ
jgi:hypothetical protein